MQHSKLIILKNISDEDFEKIKSFYINPTESKEIPIDSRIFHKEEEADNTVEIVSGFIAMKEEELEKMVIEIGLGMDMEDILHCQSYFKEEDRDPTLAELRILDTYWSDHCRHTTFMTEITDIEIEEGKYKEIFEKSLNEYFLSREYVYKEERALSLMDLATINMKEIRKKGLLDDMEVSDEINAASIEVDVDVDGVNEKWLLMFKNETHNHPTEIEPFGGAATCLGGAIRDPLSGRAFVYQAMRITGAADPNQSYEDTMEGKLPQRKITQTALDGFSSYGYQIGSATGYSKEYYDQDFLAKRMEVGALVAAAPKDWVRRESPKANDLVLLIGGRTGRDGVGAAVGSSKEQTDDALETLGAEVQKGNPAIERKIIRLFRNPQATRLIKKCNDFGAGGVAVAVGELADGIDINLDKVLLKYPSLKGWEIALSESQERMAVVIDEKDLDEFMKLVVEEDIEATVIAKVTGTLSMELNQIEDLGSSYRRAHGKNRMYMTWKGNVIADISRDFLDSNGVRKKSSVKLSSPAGDNYINNNPNHIQGKSYKEDFIKNMVQLNTGSQKGLGERLESTIGSSTVLMPYGGKYALTPEEGMVAKLPVQEGLTNTCSIMTCGYDPKLGKWSTFHGGYYSVIESITKVVALGGDYKKIRLTFQEYFERLGKDPSKWGKPFASLLGAFTVQKNLDIPSIGGKDSMSGSFEDIDVPPTLISFAVASENVNNIVSKAFKNADSQVVIVNINIDENGLIDFEDLKKNYGRIKEVIDNKKVLSSSTVGYGGIGKSIAEMAFGNKIGFKFQASILDKIFIPLYGSIILEIEKGKNLQDLFSGIDYTVLGHTTVCPAIEIENDLIDLDELIEKWKSPLDKVFPIHQGRSTGNEILYKRGNTIKRLKRIAKPRVLIPVFTGTHGEYDMAERFKEAGADVKIHVFNTLQSIEKSYEDLAREISKSQILGLPHGYILGNEPESGGKLLKIVLNNPRINEAVNKHLKMDDGLILGLGSGLHGLIKSGLIEDAKIVANKSGEFISKIVDVKLVSNLSPWTSMMEVGSLYSVAIGTDEGRILIDNKKLIDRGQIVSQFQGDNPTGSYLGIESLTSADGRVFGSVTSIDRIGKNIYKNVDIKGRHSIFESGVKYFD